MGISLCSLCGVSRKFWPPWGVQRISSPFPSETEEGLRNSQASMGFPKFSCFEGVTKSYPYTLA